MESLQVLFQPFWRVEKKLDLLLIKAPVNTRSSQYLYILPPELKDKVEGGEVRVCEWEESRKPVTYTIGLLFASWVVYTTFEMMLKLIINVI